MTAAESITIETTHGRSVLVETLARLRAEDEAGWREYLNTSVAAIDDDEATVLAHTLTRSEPCF